jgi:hypothetical protein
LHAGAQAAAAATRSSSVRCSTIRSAGVGSRASMKMQANRCSSGGRSRCVWATAAGAAANGKSKPYCGKRTRRKVSKWNHA